MKSTGAIRRIDDLGRIVIPKEIRRDLGIREGDPLELFTDCEGVYLKKYNPNSHVSGKVKRLADEIIEDYEIDNATRQEVAALLNKAAEVLCGAEGT